VFHKQLQHINKRIIMKFFSLVFSALLITTQLQAQEQTILQGDASHGGFGAPVLKMSKVNGEAVVLSGLRGAWILNHTFTLGFAGYGMLTDVQLSGQPDSLKHLHMGYGGVDVGFVVLSDNIIHLTVHSLFGGGALHQGPDFPQGEYRDDDCCDDKLEGKVDRIGVIEPEINAELNITKYVRLNMGAGYRFVWGVQNIANLKNEDISGVNGSISLKFGAF
jgi:hypothetical protein